MSHNSPIDNNKLPPILDALHQENWYLTKILALLVIISIASVGSFSVAQHFLPDNPGPVTTPLPTYNGGVCDADPSQMKYTPILASESSNTSSTSSSASSASSASSTSTHASSATSSSKSQGKPGSMTAAPSTNVEMAFMSPAHPQVKPRQSSSHPTPTPTPTPTPSPTPTPNPVPNSWYTDGFTDQDAQYAEACAAMFVTAYHTFDYSNPASFTTATSMLSASAQKLFYLGGPDDTHNLHEHMLPNWQNERKRSKQRQEVSVDKPTILTITPQYSKYIVYLDVGYNLTRQDNGAVTTLPLHDKVSLQNTNPSPKLLPKETTGWQVTDWQDADA